MDWFQKNKFVGAWLLITLLIGLALGFQLFKARGTYVEAKGSADVARGKVQKLENATPHPSPANVEAQKAQTGKLQVVVEDLRKRLAFYQAPMREVSSIELQTELKEAVAALRQGAKERNIQTPEPFNLDLGQHISQPPPAHVTSELDLQIRSLTNVAQILIDSGVDSIDSFKRERMPAEVNGAGSSSAGNDPAVPAEAEPVVTRYPFEISFTGSMESVESVFNALANSSPEDQLYHVVRMVRIENTNKQGPERIAASEGGDETLLDGAGDFASPPIAGDLGSTEETGGPEDASYIFGEERVQVFARIELLRFAEEPIAGAEEEKPADAEKKPAA